MDRALPFTHPPHNLLIEPIVRHALEEDFGRAGDITSELTIEAGARATAKLAARKAGTIAGLIAAETRVPARRSFAHIRLRNARRLDGRRRHDARVIEGAARAVLSGERVALNFAGHLSGVATATHALVEAVAGTKASIVCTRKTTPRSARRWRNMPCAAAAASITASASTTRC